MRLYDRIGSGYAARRQADPRIAAAVLAALGDAQRIVNVGAGAGSYEPAGRSVVAVEPAVSMRAQRPRGAAPCVDASAEHLPFDDASFDAAMAIYTDFHWDDPSKGIAELTRVSTGRVVLLTVDRAVADSFWLARDYLPGANGLFRKLRSVTAELPGCDVTPVPVPHDCHDANVHAFWRRPWELLDDDVRATMAIFEQLPAAIVQTGLERLRADLDSGAWAQRNQQLRGLDALDLGHRLVVWRHPEPPGTD